MKPHDRKLALVDETLSIAVSLSPLKNSAILALVACRYRLRELCLEKTAIQSDRIEAP